MSHDAEKLRSIISLDSELNKIQDVDILLERILLEARRVVNADAGSIYVVQDDKLVINYAQNDTKQRELPPGRKLIYRVFTVPITTKSVSGYAAANRPASEHSRCVQHPRGHSLRLRPPPTTSSPGTGVDRCWRYL
jgi:hypothetical protein